jgi:regulator of sirC expression with transglutaminase-like and TPR domain/S1-C subfamily serine protease
MRIAVIVSVVVLAVLPIAVRADEPIKGSATKTVEQIAESARPSVVVIKVGGRDGKTYGIGTGFVISQDGLIATNLHVIGEARPLSVEFADGKRHDVTAIHATDRRADLAIIRIDAKDLQPLELGESDRLKDGQAVVALGNPRGLKHSVVAGVVSGQREVDGRNMIQLAIPIEPGNSGGPLLDMKGRVVGIPTIKSLVTENLGFAAPIDALKPLLKKPNPIPMTAWLTIGALNAKEWEPLFGARWSQRAGRILVEGPGQGFGGRSLCLSKSAAPELPFEAAVTVRLGDEAGAAGLAFLADGQNRHYGFYPTGGKLRLTRFDGPDVLSWNILQDRASEFYHPGEWNTLKVRVEKEKLLCFVNDHLVFESDDTGLRSGAAGLCKFRDTRAEFKNFQLAREIAAPRRSPEGQARIQKLIKEMAPQQPIKPEAIEPLLPDAPTNIDLLRDEAKKLEQQAVRLRELAQQVHLKKVQRELVKVLAGKEDDIDLLHAALLIARMDNEELDLDAYRKEVDRMARTVTDALPKNADDHARLAALDRYLFKEQGFHGSREDYYHRSNSYLNEVIDDREGLPITLSVLYLELARRVGAKVVGVGMPGHFIVRFMPTKGEPRLIDVYERGETMSREEAEKRIRAITGGALKEEHLAAVTKKAIVVRMLQNLKNVAMGERDNAALLRYVDTILTVTPDSADERLIRALLRFRSADKQSALEDVNWLMENKPDGIDLEEVQKLKEAIGK